MPVDGRWDLVRRLKG